jgi:4-hydroxyphenylpyruvate dioxygenase-like putative hemolysin
MRQTVNLDEKSQEALEELARHENASKSQIIREAIQHYETVRLDWESIDDEALDWYVRLLGSKEHRIFDVDHIETLISEVCSPSEDLFNEWRRIGRKHGIEWAGQFESVEEKLRVLEYCNWYTITKIDHDTFALTTQSQTEASLFCAFLEGECQELGLDIETRQVDQKIIITDASDTA